MDNIKGKCLIDNIKFVKVIYFFDCYVQGCRYVLSYTQVIFCYICDIR